MPSPEEMEEYAEFLAWKKSQSHVPVTPSAEAMLHAQHARASAPIASPQDFKKARGTPTSAKDWKKAKGGVTELELPSGNVCRVKRPGLTALLANGTIPDILSSIVNDAIEKADGNPEAPVEADMSSLRKVLASDEGRTQLFDTTAKVVVACVVEPEVLYHRREKAAGQADQLQESYKPEWEDIPEDERNPEKLYSDEVDFDDAMFIFQYVVGGSKDLSQFR